MPHLHARTFCALCALSVMVTGCGPREGSDVAGGSDEAAASYELGREALDRRNGRADADAAVEGFERAVEADADFAAAWAGVAQARMWLQFNQGVPDQLASAEAAAARAAELAPDAVATHLALGYIDYWGHGDLDGALGHFQAAERLSSDNAEVAGAIGNIYRRKGQLDEAIAAYERRVEIDPSHGQGQTTLAGTYMSVGRYADGHAVGDHLLEIGDGRGHLWRFWANFHAGDTTSAWAEIPGIQEAQGRSDEPGYFALLQAVTRRDAAVANGLIERIGTDVGGGLRNLMAIHMSVTNQVDTYGEAFDAWIAAQASGLVDNPSGERELLAQAARLGDLAFLEALRGNTQVSMAHAAAVVELDPMSMDVWGGSGAMNDVAAAHQALGHLNPALSGLEALSAQRRGPSTGWMTFDPSFDNVRSDARFRAIMEQRRAMEQPLDSGR
jgi:tetratricopeptide (TPR) repeat protein